MSDDARVARLIEAARPRLQGEADETWERVVPDLIAREVARAKARGYAMEDGRIVGRALRAYEVAMNPPMPAHFPARSEEGKP